MTICSLSNFNQYWILQALGNAGALDRAVASIERCWGVEIALGGTSFWEISHPDWAISLRPGHPMPYGENGQTSLCHPWSAGPAPWLSKFVLGVAPGATGGAVVVTPHVTAEMARGGGVAGAVPTPRGPVEVDVRTPSGGGGGGGGGSVHVAAPVAIELVLSEVLLRRVGWLAAPLGDGPLVVVRVDGGPKMELVADGGAGAGPLDERAGAGGGARRRTLGSNQIKCVGDSRHKGTVVRMGPEVPKNVSRGTNNQSGLPWRGSWNRARKEALVRTHRRRRSREYNTCALRL